jgi:hypothetical protein
MKNRTSKWIGAWMFVVGGCDPFPHEEDTGAEESTDSGGSTTIGSEEGASISATSWGEEGGETTTSGTSSTSSGSDASCSVSIGESTVTATSSGSSDSGQGDSHTSDDGGSDTTAGGNALEACGVELEFADLDNTFICGCENCSVQYDGLTHESAADFLGACVCICEALGCGVSISGGVGDEGGEDVGEGTASGTSAGGEDDGDTEFTGGEVTGKYEGG